MFQSFETTSTPEHGPARLADLRAQLDAEALDGFIIPRADAHQGEYVAPRDERLQWLTGFTGSAGFCCALKSAAGVFIDGRYRTQVKSQVDLDHFTPVPWPDTSLTDWLKDQLPDGGTIGFDPWLMTHGQIETYRAELDGTGIILKPTDNLVDRIWTDQPAPPAAKAEEFPLEYAGKSSTDKRTECARDLSDAGADAAVLTLPDGINWLLNIRGADVQKTPLLHSFAILHSDGRVQLFVAPEKVAHFGPDPSIDVALPDVFLSTIRALSGTVRVNKQTVPVAVTQALGEGEADIQFGEDPTALPKACKNDVEIDGARAAHLTDGAAMCELLAWLDAQNPGTINEIDVVFELEQRRRATNALKDISFDTISGSGPNGAIMHYRVTNETSRVLQNGELLVLDSGGQYLNGTTDITRTIAIGTAGEEEAAAFTRVLKGMITISTLRWPDGLAGRDLEAFGRHALWQAGQDFNHGVGHGVGHYLGVHEGPQRLARTGTVPFKPGMILSNEPGYYREGAFGIRIENLVVVRSAEPLPTQDPERDFLDFETLTYVPIDRRLIKTDMLTTAETDWINSYHAACREKLTERLSDGAQSWLAEATQPL